MTTAIAQFMGSWWAVLLHASWFSVWLIFDLGIEALTLWVSLEAIFIGIFLLMAANRAEAERDHKANRESIKQRKMIGADISMDRQQSRDIEEIKKGLKRLERQLNHLRQNEQ